MSRVNFTEFAGSFPFNGAHMAAPKSEATRTLAGLMLAGVMAAMLVVADQVIDNWADGHLLAAWVLMWVMAFTAMAFLAPAARRLAGLLVTRLDAWSARVAQRRADARLWAIAQKDARVMKDIVAASRD